MKTSVVLFALATLCFGSMSFASDTASTVASASSSPSTMAPPPLPPGPPFQFDFSCQFGGARKGLVCLAVGEACAELSLPIGEPSVSRKSRCGHAGREEHRLAIVCTDGYFDRDRAFARFHKDDLFITSSEEDGRDRIIIEDVFKSISGLREGRRHEGLEAKLLREDGLRLQGRCELHPEMIDLDSTSVE